MSTFFEICLFFGVSFLIFVVKTSIYKKTFDSKIMEWAGTLVVKRKKDNKIAAILWPWQYYHTKNGKEIRQEYSDYIPPDFGVPEAILQTIWAIPLLFVVPVFSCLGISLEIILGIISEILSEKNTTPQHTTTEKRSDNPDNNTVQAVQHEQPEDNPSTKAQRIAGIQEGIAYHMANGQSGSVANLQKELEELLNS